MTAPSRPASPLTIVQKPHRTSLAAAGGVAALIAGLGLGELTAALTSIATSPTGSVGSVVIDLTPGWFKEFMISAVGTADKFVLVALIIVVASAVGAIAGVLELSRPPGGRAVLGGLAVVCAIAALSRAGAGLSSVLPAGVAWLVAALVLVFLVRRLRPGVAPATTTRRRAAERGDAPTPAPAAESSIDRRRFLLYSAAAVVVGVAAGAMSRVAGAGARAAQSARSLLRLPAAAIPAPAVPAGAALDVAGITPLVTANGDFYRIDTALAVPDVNPDDWALTVNGMVEHPITITFAELLALPLTEKAVTLACVSNVVGGDLIGNATWLGYPINELLARAKPAADADMVLSRSVDGFTASTPLEALTDDRGALLAVGMNGEPLPFEHGFPVRMVVPGLYGYVSATKWVTEMTVTRFDRDTAYWTRNGWSPLGPIKTESRIDVPRNGEKVAAGTVTIAGVAWAQTRGIDKVEVRIDSEPWREATLARAISADTWVQWLYEWQATPGTHMLTVRATDSTGVTQTETQVGPVPDGATGWDRLTVNVG